MPMCRLSIHADDGDTNSAVDVVLPTSSPVVAFLPDIVGLAGLSATVDGRRWRLVRPSGASVDECRTLSDNGIRDGDVLVLVSESPRRREPRSWDPAHAVISAPDRHAAGSVDVTAFAAAAIVAVVAASAWTGVVDAHRWSALLVAVVAAVVATARAVLLRRDAMRGAAVAAWAGTGFLVVPAGPSAANVLLASAAAGTAAVVLSRWTDRASATLVSMATLSAALLVAVGPATIWPVRAPAVGAVMVVAALGSLGASARIAAAMSGTNRDEVPDAADRAHAVLDGLVAGCACAVAMGAIVVAVASHADAVQAAAFTGAVAVSVSLRSRTYADRPRRVMLMVSGSCSAAASLAVCVAGLPTAAQWYAPVFIGLGLLTNAVIDPSPAVRRIADAAEYTALGAVIPLACWVGGLYAAARGWYVS